MPVGSGRVKVLNDRLHPRQQTTDIPIYKDNTTDIEAAELRARQQFAHIREPDDYTGKSTRRGSLDSGSASKFSGTVVVAPST